MVFGKLDPRSGFVVRGVPNLTQFKKCSGGLECICCLSVFQPVSNSTKDDREGKKKKNQKYLLSNFVRPHGSIRTVEDLRRKLFHVGMSSHIIHHSIIIHMLAFKLSSRHPSQHHQTKQRKSNKDSVPFSRTCSSLSTRFVVYSLIWSSVVCRPLSII